MAANNVPKNVEGKRIFYSGIENLSRIEEDLYAHLADSTIALGHILNHDGGIDLQPMRPDDAYNRRDGLDNLPPQPGDSGLLANYEKRMEKWSVDASKALSIVKSIYGKNITDVLKTIIPANIYNVGSRDNIVRVMTTVRNRWGGYTVAKSDLSEKNLRELPKFTSPSGVISILSEMRYEILQREDWSDLNNGIDYRFSEETKKSRLVSLMDSWDELHILHNRLRVAQRTMTFDRIRDELLEAIHPLQEAELIEQQTARVTDRNHSSINSSMTAQGNAVDWRSSQSKSKVPSVQCYNCTGTGHKSRECTAPMCMSCEQTWASIRAPGYHHNSECPHKGGGTATSLAMRCTNCQIVGHNRRDCKKPICSSCGTSWSTNKHPSYHHCDKCPHPYKSPSTVLGKRNRPFIPHSTPWSSPQSRAHMSNMRELYLEEAEFDTVNQDESISWSQEADLEEDVHPWQSRHT